MLGDCHTCNICCKKNNYLVGFHGFEPVSPASKVSKCSRATTELKQRPNADRLGDCNEYIITMFMGLKNYFVKVVRVNKQ